MAELEIEISKEKYDGLEEAVKEFYQPGKIKVDGQEQDGYIAEGLGGLKTTLTKQKEKLDAYKNIKPEDAIAGVKFYNEFGEFDFEKANAALETQQKLDDKKLVDADDFTEAEKRINDKWSKKFEELDAQRLKDKERAADVDLQELVLKHNALPERVHHLIRELKEKHISFHVDKSDNATWKNKDGLGEANLDEIIEPLKDAPGTSFFFKAENVSGNEANGNRGQSVNTKTTDRKTFEGWSAEKQMAFSNDGGTLED